MDFLLMSSISSQSGLLASNPNRNANRYMDWLIIRTIGTYPMATVSNHCPYEDAFLRFSVRIVGTAAASLITEI